MGTVYFYSMVWKITFMCTPVEVVNKELTRNSNLGVVACAHRKQIQVAPSCGRSLHWLFVI